MGLIAYTRNGIVAQLNGIYELLKIFRAILRYIWVNPGPSIVNGVQNFLFTFETFTEILSLFFTFFIRCVVQTVLEIIP